uniref:Small ribosomal subunit protein uS5c n=1 Tax=Cyanidium caldarium TaxID=2771 RepID=RR5_CYACA|nr:ribosomal protein S5 [Cyanidium caldarium]Q9TLU8.1 RecName: Full=Small ribosomal subunit protein uS5c; AltName: Full=30S ribosomal protein S5, chloroplastic [Cyanidium caldarium]AAF12923.1 unknown [Cyanidium caldarium]WDB00296.1 ribosomal protein S5 [Cyanidium caldarium]
MSRDTSANSSGQQNYTWSERVIQITRVTKVVKGGKKLSFRAIIVIGNNQGSVGVGVGKASDVIGAVKKGVSDCKKQIIEFPLTSSSTISHAVEGRFGAASVILKPSVQGSGVIAGGAMRTVIELSGIKNIVAKQLGTKNHLNNAKATINALSKLNSKSSQLSLMSFSN